MKMRCFSAFAPTVGARPEMRAAEVSKARSGAARPSLANARLENRFQFERTGYFCLDSDSIPVHLVFNRTLPLKDSWAKIGKRRKRRPPAMGQTLAGRSHGLSSFSSSRRRNPGPPVARLPL